MTVTIHLHFYGTLQGVPTLEVSREDGQTLSFRFGPMAGRRQGEMAWLVRFELAVHSTWRFRINLSNDTYACPYQGGSFDWFETGLHTLWVQNGQIYDYEPTPFHSLSRTVKIPNFTGSLPKRALYVYLPRGYDQHVSRRYPVIYMHDGQNCFEAWVQDSFAGSWLADQSADYLIATGKMRECIIVGVSNSHSDRIAEYLPPTARFDPQKAEDGSDFTPIQGRSDRTASFYQDEVASFIDKYYRTLPDRYHRATCGSSMGGLFSLYLAWDHPDFAHHHAVMSPSLWITGDADNSYENPRIIQQLREQSARDVRIWLDSGTKYSEHHGDDGMTHTMLARDALLENGYDLGRNLGYYLQHGGIHNEASWAARLPKVFQFLFPLMG